MTKVETNKDSDVQRKVRNKPNWLVVLLSFSLIMNAFLIYVLYQNQKQTQGIIEYNETQIQRYEQTLDDINQQLEELLVGSHFETPSDSTIYHIIFSESQSPPDSTDRLKMIKEEPTN